MCVFRTGAPSGVLSVACASTRRKASRRTRWLASAALGAMIAMPAQAQVIDYANGSNNSSGIQITTNATQLQTLAGVTATQSGVISEDAAGRPLEKIGTGSLIITGNNTYTGITTISGGTLQIGNGGPSGSIVGNVVNNAALVFNRSLIYSNVISGTGTVTVASGTVVLNGSNLYSGQTNVNAGALEVGNSFALGSGLLVLANGTRLQSTTPNLTLANDVLLTPGSEAIFAQNVTLTLNGALSGAGTLNAQGTKIELNDPNSYTGGTKLFGGTLQLGNNAALGTGPLTTLAGGTLQAGGVSIGNTINVDNLVFDTQDFAATLTGTLTGTLPFEKIGTGALTLSGINTYSGGTTISAGTLAISSDANLGDPTGAVTLSGGTLEFTDYVTSPASRTYVIGSGNGTIQVDRASTISGPIIGPGHVTYSGLGGLVLTGNNAYSGGTIIYNGAILVGNGGTTGWITGDVISGVATSNAGINFDRSDDVTFSGNISGLGYVAQYGTGTLTLTGNNTYAGSTTVLSGRLAFANDANVGTGDITIYSGTVQYNASFTSALN
jgi:fibronectin-binding autotransporter adhesin